MHHWGYIPVNTKHLFNIYTTTAQRLRRWSAIVWMLYKCFVFTVILLSDLSRGIGVFGQYLQDMEPQWVSKCRLFWTWLCVDTKEVVYNLLGWHQYAAGWGRVTDPTASLPNPDRRLLLNRSRTLILAWMTRRTGKSRFKTHSPAADDMSGLW